MEDRLPLVDMTDPELWRQPGARFAPWFEEGVPAGRVASSPSVMLFRHADVREALCDPRLGAMGVRAFEALGWKEGPFVDWMRHNIVALDPPAHTRLRALVGRAFTPRRVAELAPLARSVAHGLADDMAEAREVDFYGAFAQRLPLHIICAMLAIPGVDHAQMQRWTEAINVATGIPRPSAREAADEAVQGVVDYVKGLIDERRKSPGDDLLSALIDSQEEGARLSSEELPVMVIQLLVAGHETTRNLIGNGLFTLMQHPDELRSLRQDRSLVPNAVEEMIRFEPSLIWVSRIPREDLVLGGVEIVGDELLLLNLAAANRDPAVHADPQRFDVRRGDIQVLSFGMGTHYCIGASLARLEGRIAFEVLLDRFSDIQFAGDTPRFAAYTALRTLESMELRLTPA
ncbi:MAG: cytochrome P450 [Deltaproteobacteria bacterium]|jgi:cytochrome P450|nr:cytochrome P450 [Deltaproteobacteria bacterium]